VLSPHQPTAGHFPCAGSIKGDVKRKHFSLRGSSGTSLTSSPFWSCGVATIRSSSVVFTSALRHPSLAEASQAYRWSRLAGQPWFYLRLAPRRGTMAFLGYPREHTVALETWRLRRLQPNPPRILTLEPELAARKKTRSKTRLLLRSCALKRLVTSDIQRRTALLSSTHAT